MARIVASSVPKSKARRPLLRSTAAFHCRPSTSRIRLRSKTSRSAKPVIGWALRFSRLRVASTTRPAQRIGRSVISTMAPNPAKSTKATMPSSAACTRLLAIGVPARMAGNTKIGKASNPAIPSSEKAVRPPTAVAVSVPEAASIRNCVAAPNAAPPGTTRLMAFPASCEVATENQALVRRAIRCSAIVQAKCATWRMTAKANQTGASEVNFGKEAKTSARLGKTR